MKNFPVISLILTVMTLFFFQNCNRMTTTADLVNSADNSSVSKSNITVETIKSVSFYVDGLQTVNKAGGSFSVKYKKILKLNLSTNELIETNDFDSSVQVYCLPNEIKEELLGILNAAQVCKSQDSSGDQICGMAMQLPYCEIEMPNEVIGLGSATDTCHRNAIDLCDDQHVESLKSYMDSLNSSYQSMSCPTN